MDVDGRDGDGEAVGVRLGFDVGLGVVDGWLVGLGVGVVEGMDAGVGRTSR